MTEIERKYRIWEESISNRYKERFTKDGIVPDFIMDGVIDPDKYANAKIKILFLNREPNDSGADGWLNRDLRNQIINGERIFLNNHNIVPNLFGTFLVIHQLCNESASSLDVEQFCELINEQINSTPNHSGEFMLSTAYMNLKKIGGGAKTQDAILVEDLATGWNIIKKQILYLNPTIIVSGNIRKYLDANDPRIQFTWAKDYPGFLYDDKSIPALHGMIIDGKEYPILDLYHPSSPSEHDYYSWKQLYDLLLEKGLDFWQKRFDQECFKN